MERKRTFSSATSQPIIRARENSSQQATKREAVIKDSGSCKEAAKCNCFTKPNYVH
jgi:hypothetical protein